MSRFNGIKAAQNRQIERKEEAILERLKIEADIEEIKSRETQIKKRIALTQVDTTREAEKQAVISLRTAQTQTSIAGVGLGKTHDKLLFEQADRMLTQREMALNLTLKGVNVNALEEQLRHQEFLHGQAKVSAPKFEPVQAKMRFPFRGS